LAHQACHGTASAGGSVRGLRSRSTATQVKIASVTFTSSVLSR
jgi:hypothetical protein